MSKEMKGHVHFGEGDDALYQKDNTILVESKGTGLIDVHLGFLQAQHHYKLSVVVPKNKFLDKDTQTLLKAAECTAPNVNCRLLYIEEERDNFHLIVEFFAYKEKLLKETIQFLFEDSSPSIKVTFNARVLGKGKGTPLLKYGIQCTGVEVDELSEASDWPGFD